MSGCGCVYTSYDGERASVTNITTVAARKPNKCHECGDEIPKGTRHELAKGCWEGSWSTYRTCFACIEVRESLFCDGWNYGAIWEDVEEYIRGGGKVWGCLEKMELVAAKDKLMACYRRVLKLDI